MIGIERSDEIDPAKCPDCGGRVLVSDTVYGECEDCERDIERNEVGV